PSRGVDCLSGAVREAIGQGVRSGTPSNRNFEELLQVLDERRAMAQAGRGGRPGGGPRAEPSRDLQTVAGLPREAVDRSIGCHSQSRRRVPLVRGDRFWNRLGRYRFGDRRRTPSLRVEGRSTVEHDLPPGGRRTPLRLYARGGADG